MNAKLTLSLDREAIEMGKRHAADTGRSLSSVVEQYLLLLGKEGRDDALRPVSRDLLELVGIGAGPFDEEDYKAHLLSRQA